MKRLQKVMNGYSFVCTLLTMFFWFSMVQASRVMTIGGATEDLFIVYKNPGMMQLNTRTGTESFLLLKEGSKFEIEHIGHGSGGGATNAAVSFRRFGYDVGIITKVGVDKQGQAVVQELQNQGIDTSAIVWDEEHATGMSFIIPTLAGDRTVFAFRGANGFLTAEDLLGDQLKQADCVYITSLSGAAATLLPKITEAAHQHGVLVAVNPGSGQLRNGAVPLQEALAHIDILILNKDEAQLLYASLSTDEQPLTDTATTQKGSSAMAVPALLQTPHDERCFDLKKYFMAIRSRGPKTIVVTNGSEGVYVAHEGYIYFHPSLKGPVCNTLGAGDAFGSTFVASILAGDMVQHALHYALINSLSVVGELDAKKGLLSRKALVVKAQGLDPLLLQRVLFDS